jgi:hypothetical protein
MVASKKAQKLELIVRLVNQSDHPLRIPVRGFICADKPGWISAHFTLTASGSPYVGCGISVGEPGEFDIVSASAMWKLLRPGDSFDVRDEFSKLIPGGLERGDYSFHAVYSGPHLTDDQKRKLAMADISTAFGQYTSKQMILKIE